jgi:hypothetical protein
VVMAAACSAFSNLATVLQLPVGVINQLARRAPVHSSRDF